MHNERSREERLLCGYELTEKIALGMNNFLQSFYVYNMYILHTHINIYIYVSVILNNNVPLNMKKEITLCSITKVYISNQQKIMM